MRAFVALALLLAVSAVSAQNVTVQVYHNSGNCSSVPFANATGDVISSGVVALNAGCNVVAVQPNNTAANLNLTYSCNATTGAVSVWVFDNANCTGTGEAGTFNNGVCQVVESFSVVYNGCAAVAPVASSSSSTGVAAGSSTGSSAVSSTGVAAGSSTGSSTGSSAVSSTGSSTGSGNNNTIVSSTGAGASSSTSAPVVPSSSSVPKTPTSSSSSGVGNSAVQAAVSMFALAATAVVALL